MSRIVFIGLLLQLASATCLGQSSFQGLTPGQSTKADVERALGKPVNRVSKTLVEYKSPDGSAKLYVQYGDDSSKAVVYRIELTCQACPTCPSKCENGSAYGIISQSVDHVEFDARVLEASKTASSSQPDKATAYFGPPRLLRFVEHWKPNFEFEYRVALMSPELYESALPQGGCTGTIFGIWDTDPSWKRFPETQFDLGRVKIERVGDDSIKGSYEKNNGSFTLKLDGPAVQNFLHGRSQYKGEWKDDLGFGTVVIKLRDTSDIRAKFKRTSGRTSQKPASSKSSAARNPYDNPYLDNWYGKCTP